MSVQWQNPLSPMKKRQYSVMSAPIQPVLQNKEFYSWEGKRDSLKQNQGTLDKQKHKQHAVWCTILAVLKKIIKMQIVCWLVNLCCNIQGLLISKAITNSSADLLQVERHCAFNAKEVQPQWFQGSLYDFLQYTAQ